MQFPIAGNNSSLLMIMGLFMDERIAMFSTGA